jgi:exonuclease SbcC
MKKIEFKRIFAQNFFCFGNDGIEINFKNYNNIVLVNGVNLDSTAKDSEEPASNGSGKSTIPEIIVYGFFGKTIKKPKKLNHKDVINNKTSKKLKIEIEWDKYKLIRTRKPDGLRLFESDKGVWDETTEITLGGMPATQKKIEDILGLSYESFVNIAVFTDNNSVSFLECDAAEKRTIVENLLSLEKFRNYQEASKKILKGLKEKLASKDMELTYANKALTDNVDLIEKYKKDIKQYKDNMVNKFIEIKNEIAVVQKQIDLLKDNNSELKIYQEQQNKLPEIDIELQEIETNKTKALKNIEKGQDVLKSVKNEIEELDSKYQSSKLEKSSYESQGKLIAASIEKINKLEDGIECQHCMSVISKDNYAAVLTKHKEEAATIKNNWTTIKQLVDNLETERNDKVNQKNSVLQAVTLQEEKVKTYNKKTEQLLSEKSKIIQMPKPDAEKKLSGFVNKIEILTTESLKYDPDQIWSTPYDNYLIEAQDKSTNLKEEYEKIIQYTKEIREEMKYYDYWSVAFGEQGIRKYIIDEVVPALNENLKYWLNILINGNLRIKFDNQFEDYIDKIPEESQLSYFAISGGQKRRINLALSQAFAHVMSLNTGRYLDLVFLDEVTSNIDKSGAEAIYRMITELSADRKVFVTTHDQNLLEYLKSCDRLNLVLKNGEAKLEN